MTVEGGGAAWDLTSVADDGAVFHRHGPDPVADVVTGLEPETDFERHGIAGRTLARPGGALLCRFATVNDVHFGETECGKIGDVGDAVAYLATPGGPPIDLETARQQVAQLVEGLGPSFVATVGEGETPYPEMMSRAAAAEIAAISPAAVVAKGDLTGEGTEAEYAAFRDCYRSAFAKRLVEVRGNHDAMGGLAFAAEPCQEVTLPGVTLAVLDTVVPGIDRGRLTDDQIEWLDELAARADRPVCVFGHHHPWQPGSKHRSATYFGINPDDSERLVDVVARRPAIVGYFAGHTHRNRVRRFAETGDVPYVEVACVKDFPGSWAEYRVFEGGIVQVHRRISSPEALRWSELNRGLFWGMYPGYALGRWRTGAS